MPLYEAFTYIFDDDQQNYDVRDCIGHGPVNQEVDHLSEGECENNLVYVVEYSSYLSLFAFIGMLIPLAISGEYRFWPGRIFLTLFVI